jgi:TetR/AcrR family transcriptional regulator, cholesterol catabolism regulator
VRQRIIEKAEQLFFKYGIKSVTMDDIARELGISKKTIYQHFTDKDGIVMAVAENHFSCDRVEAEQMQTEAIDPIAELVLTSEMMRASLSELNPAMIFDLRKYYPSVWGLFQQYKHEFIMDLLRKNLLRGVELGLYRADLNVEVIARVRLEQVDAVFNTDAFPSNKFNFLEVQLIMLDHFIRGIVTDKGAFLYQQYLQGAPKRVVPTELVEMK